MSVPNLSFSIFYPSRVHEEMIKQKAYETNQCKTTERRIFSALRELSQSPSSPDGSRKIPLCFANNTHCYPKIKNKLEACGIKLEESELHAVTYTTAIVTLNTVKLKHDGEEESTTS